MSLIIISIVTTRIYLHFAVKILQIFSVTYLEHISGYKVSDTKKKKKKNWAYFCLTNVVGASKAKRRFTEYSRRPVTFSEAMPVPFFHFVT